MDYGKYDRVSPTSNSRHCKALEFRRLVLQASTTVRIAEQLSQCAVGLAGSCLALRWRARLLSD